MKVYVCLTFVAAVLFLQVAEAAGVPDVKDLDKIDFGTALKLILVEFKRIMPCGVKNNFPSLVPYHLEHYDVTPYNSIFNISGHMSNLYIYGLDNVEILALDFNSTTKRLSYDLLAKEIQIVAEYNITGKIFLRKFPIDYFGEGLINNKLSDLRIVGHFDLVPVIRRSNGVRIDNFRFNFYLGNAAVSNVNYYWDNALNNFVNKFLSEAILTGVQQVQKYTDGKFAQLYLEMAVNQTLEEVSEKDLLAALTKYIVLLQTVNCPVV